jgi:energy-coupling factor transporter transmembrane protein EcfT
MALVFFQILYNLFLNFQHTVTTFSLNQIAYGISHLLSPLIIN